jgi:cyclopropane-fatty-acyl-phospholipid synthase
MLALSAARAEVADGQEILDLGCGWGSFSLWAAEHFPHSAASWRCPIPGPRATLSGRLAAARGLTQGGGDDRGHE